jgi:phosphoglycolate phosphatase
LGAPCDAVIFDLDGTLLDTLDDLADSMNSVLSRFGFPSHPVGSYKHFVGEGVATLVRRALPPGKRTDEQVRRGVEAMREEYSKRWNVKTRPYPGIPELLDRLRSRNIPLAVLSNKPHSFAGTIVSAYFSRWPFTHVFGEKDGKRKPDPGRALQIASDLEIPAGSVCFVGDTWTDMETAKQAGMFAVGALWGFRSARELRDSGAAVLIENPAELLEHIRSDGGKLQ